MGQAANEIDNLGDQLADESLTRVERATRTEQMILTGLIAGALLIGATLAVAAGRVLARLRALYESEQQSRHELARALQTKTDFIADASHELRTPLAVILGNAETALVEKDDHLHRIIAFRDRRGGEAYGETGRRPAVPGALRRWFSRHLIKSTCRPVGSCHV